MQPIGNNDIPLALMQAEQSPGHTHSSTKINPTPVN
jgi:hypothetical protein